MMKDSIPIDQDHELMTYDEVCSNLRVERRYQVMKWGKNPHSLAEWIMILESELAESRRAWMKEGNERCREELTQVAAVAIACLQEHGLQNCKEHLTQIALRGFDADGNRIKTQELDPK